jgi:glycosyltransferase involved in cell wall biosynthesis
MSLRILYHHRIRAEDGQAVHVREMIGALRRCGHEVRECALVQKTVARSETGKAKPSFWQKLRLPRAAVEALEIGYNGKARAMLQEAAAAWKPDIVYERHALHCRAGLDAARKLSVPLLLEVNSPMTDEMERLGLLKFARRARATERLVLGGADRVLAVTRALGDRLVELGARPESIVVIGNGAQPERYGADARAAAKEVRKRWGLPPQAVVLGFVGFMREWHRLDMAVDALTKPAFRNAHLVLVGEGPSLPDLLARATRLGVHDRVHACGLVPAELVPAHVLAFDVALIPAINGYASPLKLFDSMAAGIATIAPDQPNLRETVEDGVHASLFASGSAADFEARLAALVGDSSLRARIGVAAAQRLSELDLTWDGNAARVESIAKELLARRQR